MTTFYCFVLIVDLKASGLAIINFKQTLEFLLALQIFIDLYIKRWKTASSCLVPSEIRLENWPVHLCCNWYSGVPGVCCSQPCSLNKVSTLPDSVTSEPITASLPFTLLSLTQQEPQLKVIIHWFYRTIPLMHTVHQRHWQPLSLATTQTCRSFFLFK